MQAADAETQRAKKDAHRDRVEQLICFGHWGRKRIQETLRGEDPSSEFPGGEVHDIGGGEYPKG